MATALPCQSGKREKHSTALRISNTRAKHSVLTPGLCYISVFEENLSGQQHQGHKFPVEMMEIKCRASVQQLGKHFPLKYPLFASITSR